MKTYLKTLRCILNRVRTAMQYGGDMASSRDLAIKDAVSMIDELLTQNEVIADESFARTIISLRSEALIFKDKPDFRYFIHGQIRFCEGFLLANDAL